MISLKELKFIKSTDTSDLGVEHQCEVQECKELDSDMEPDNTSAGANDLFIIYVYSLLYYIDTQLQNGNLYLLSPLNHQLNCLYKVHNHCWEIHFRNHYMNNRL